MSLDKAIANGKERRKPYRGSKAIDPSCRNHGGCPWCEENRKHKFRERYIEDDDSILPLLHSLPCGKRKLVRSQRERTDGCPDKAQ